MERKIDIYCWVCVKKNGTIRCINCCRIFHKRCIANSASQLFEEDWICAECVKESNYDDTSSVDVTLIPLIIDFIAQDTQLKALQDVKVDKKADLLHPIDLTEISQKKYKNLSELRFDMKWFSHDCRILYPRTPKILVAAKKLMNFLEEEIRSVLKCAECYKNAHNHPEISFVMPCKSVHLLIWAKAVGYSYWPAKVMSIDDENMVHVRFFGDHTTSDVPVHDCFLYSEKFPEGSIDNFGQNYNLAITEVNEYIANIRTKFGSFNFAVHRAAIDPAKLKDYVKYMTNTLEPDEEQSESSSASCINCNDYEQNNPNEAHLMVCDPPHIVIWAKYEDTGYKPAKVMCCYDDDESAKVFFFGTHEKIDVFARDCFLYSQEYPDDANPRETDQATKEVNAYITNIKTEYGCFNFAKRRVIFDMEKIDEYVNEMVTEKPSKAENNQLKSNRSSAHLDDLANEPASKRSSDAVINVAPNSKAENNQPNSKRSSAHLDILADEPASKRSSDAAINPESNSEEFTLYENRIKNSLINTSKDIGRYHMLIKNKINTLEKTLENALSEKKDLVEQIHALKQEHLNEKNQFEEEKQALEGKIVKIQQDSIKKMCFQCKGVIDSLSFCNSECLRKHFESTQNTR